MEDSSKQCPARDNDDNNDDDDSRRRRNNTGGRKRLRILVVHDFDLKSTARLAESSLLSSNNIQSQKHRSRDPFLEKSVDLCIGVNAASSRESCTPDDDDGVYDLNDELLPYYQGPARRIRMLQTKTLASPYERGTTTAESLVRRPRNPYTYTYNGTEVRHLRGRPRIGKKVLSTTSFRSIPVPVPLPPASQPTFFFDDRGQHDNNNGRMDHHGAAAMGAENASRMQHSSAGIVSPEERAARRGLITAALSQLERIVCRVVYVLQEEEEEETTDGSSSNIDSGRRRRLTSNSHDVRNRWLPLAEGLGVTGFVADAQKQIHSSSSSSSDGSSIVPGAAGGEIGTARNNNGNVLNGDDQNSNPPSRMLEELLRSAHPLPTPGQETDDHRLGERFGDKELPSLLFQSIAITTTSTSTTTSSPKDELKGEPPTPPKAEHTGSENGFFRDHLLLEIVAGAEAPPSLMKSNYRTTTTTTVIVPGSLRTRGEFCLVDLVLDDGGVEGASGVDIDIGTDSGKPQRPFRWRVEETHFHRLESEQDTRDWHSTR